MGAMLARLKPSHPRLALTSLDPSLEIIALRLCGIGLLAKQELQFNGATWVCTVVIS
jgi:hypothetical protein